VAALIVYGSTYPWRFIGGSPGGWQNYFYLTDFLVNIALYLPVGLFARFALGGPFWAPLLACCSLSTAVEVLQSMMPVRVSSVFDVISNTTGAAAGVAMGAAMKRRLRVTLDRAGVDGSALLLLFCSLMYPLIAMRDHLPLSTGTVVLSAGLLAEGARARRPWLWLLGAALVVLARFPAVNVAVGAALGIAFYAGVRNRRWPMLPAAVLIGVLVFRGLYPFRLAGEAAPYSVVPFAALLESPWQSGILILLEKVFFYGMATWLLRRAGTPTIAATATVAILLALIEVAQMWLPGRSAEITDPVLALLIATALDAFRGNPAARRKA
jgi:VanZ family protein